jgi:acetyl esterase
MDASVVSSDAALGHDRTADRVDEDAHDGGATDDSDASVRDGGDATTDASPIAPSAELIFEPVSSRDVLDCFPSLRRPPLRERVLSYKRIFAQNIRGTTRAIHPRAYVLSPPGHDARTPLPVVAMFHGGGWEFGSPVLWMYAARYFAARGMLAIVFQYRLGVLHGSTPRQSTADALSAVRWIRRYASQLGADPNRIATVGDSAGGHLALATSTVPSIVGEDDGASNLSAVPNLHFALYPVASLPAPEQAEIDPMRGLSASRLVPTFIFHGTVDALSITPYRASVAYCERHRSLGAAGCVVAPFEGQGHNFLPNYYTSTMVYLDAFLFDHGYTSGARADLSAYAFGAAAHCRFDFDRYAALEREYMLVNRATAPVW